MNRYNGKEEFVSTLHNIPLSFVRVVANVFSRLIYLDRSVLFRYRLIMSTMQSRVLS